MVKLLTKHADKLRFIVVGATNTGIDFAILFSLVNVVGMPIFFSNIISTSIALTFSFFANKTFTFKDTDKNSKKQIINFLSITLVGLWIIQPIIIWITAALLYYAQLDDNIVLLSGKLLATSVTLVWNYLLYRKFVFKNTNPTVTKS